MFAAQRLAAVVCASLVVLAGCSEPAQVQPSPTESTSGAAWRTDDSEPYPFVTPVPPRAPTPVDGTYERNLPDGSKPIPCRRCAPFRLDRGRAVLELAEGRYHLNHEAADFRTYGHYLVSGDRLELFNDPNCPETRGLYRWTRASGELTLDVVRDPCPFDLLRARYLTAAPWLER